MFSSLFFSIFIFSSTFPISGEFEETITLLLSHSNFIIFLSFSLVNKDALSITLYNSDVFALIERLKLLGINLLTSD